MYILQMEIGTDALLNKQRINLSRLVSYIEIQNCVWDKLRKKILTKCFLLKILEHIYQLQRIQNAVLIDLCRRMEPDNARFSHLMPVFYFLRKNRF